jgi:hypothetical protein
MTNSRPRRHAITQNALPALFALSTPTFAPHAATAQDLPSRVVAAIQLGSRRAADAEM